MARLGRSQPVNWALRNRPPANLAIPASPTTLPAAVSLTAGASVSGSATLAEITNLTSVPFPPGTGEMDIGVGLTAGGLIVWDATLPIEADVEADPSAWQYIGGVPVSYLQYLAAGGSLTVTPGQTVVAMEEASGWPYDLPVPPADGRWLVLGAGGQLDAVEAPGGEMGADLSWDPPPHLAHLPVPFDVIRRRIEAKQR